jgi:hypothetical protein
MSITCLELWIGAIFTAVQIWTKQLSVTFFSGKSNLHADTVHWHNFHAGTMYRHNFHAGTAHWHNFHASTTHWHNFHAGTMYWHNFHAGTVYYTIFMLVPCIDTIFTLVPCIDTNVYLLFCRPKWKIQNFCSFVVLFWHFLMLSNDCHCPAFFGLSLQSFEKWWLEVSLYTHMH